LVRPVATLTEAAEAIAAGDYHQHVYFDSRDELGALAASFNRMSERLDTRDTELRESSQRLTTVLEGMDEGVLSLDDRQRIVLANSAAGRLLGFSPKAAEGRPLLEVVRNHKLHSALLESQSARESRRVEIEVGESDSRVLSIYATLVPGERTTRFVLVLQDITDLRRLESMRQEFVANVSHELKTPLSSIKAYAETLSHGAINDAEHNLRFVNSIEEQAERLHQLILDLLSLARIESGQQAFDIAAVNLPSVVLACLAEHRANADSKGVQLTSAGEGDSLKVRADEEGTRQILNNLVANAINYTPEGGSVVVHWRREESKGVIEVADTGIGISPEHLPRLFERFYRVDKARSRELGGTGLGLSIVKHLTQSFGGTVEVVSQPGRGTTFTVRLPLA
jgi:two-component system phosphate regulon sensor histidine kinase PhoR